MQLLGDWRRAHPQLRLGVVYGVFAGWDAYRQQVSAMGHGTMLAIVHGAHQRFCWIGAAAQPDTLPVTLLERIWSSAMPRPQIRVADLCWFAQDQQRDQLLERDQVLAEVNCRMRQLIAAQQDMNERAGDV